MASSKIIVCALLVAVAAALPQQEDSFKDNRRAVDPGFGGAPGAGGFGGPNAYGQNPYGPNPYNPYSRLGYNQYPNQYNPYNPQSQYSNQYNPYNPQSQYPNQQFGAQRPF